MHACVRACMKVCLNFAGKRRVFAVALITTTVLEQHPGHTTSALPNVQTQPAVRLGLDGQPTACSSMSLLTRLDIPAGMNMRVSLCVCVCVCANVCVRANSNACVPLYLPFSCRNRSNSRSSSSSIGRKSRRGTHGRVVVVVYMPMHAKG